MDNKACRMVSIPYREGAAVTGCKYDFEAASKVSIPYREGAAHVGLITNKDFSIWFQSLIGKVQRNFVVLEKGDIDNSFQSLIGKVQPM